MARHRRPLLLLVVLAALWSTIRLAAPPDPPTVAVAVVSHDLAAGRRLTAADIQIASWPAQVAPSGKVSAGAAQGQILATAMSTGEVITRARMLGPGLLAGQPAGTVAITVRLVDPASLAPVRAGDRVDVLAAAAEPNSWDDEPAAGALGSAGSAAGAGSADGTPAAGGAEQLAAAALVLAKPGGADGSQSSGDAGWAAGSLGSATGGAGLSGTADSSGPGVLVLAVDQHTAARLAGAAGSRPLSVVLLGTG